MSQAKPRVFITQENSQLNYGHAEEYGEIVFLTAKEVSPVPGSIINADIMAELERKLADFDFDNDFLAPSGSPVVCGLTFFMLGKMAERAGFPSVRCLRVLRWSNRDRVYQPIHITI
jgi:hypothetical protein